LQVVTCRATQLAGGGGRWSFRLAVQSSERGYIGLAWHNLFPIPLRAPMRSISGNAPQGDAPVELVPYDPLWPSQFEAERVMLRVVLAPWLAGPIEHVGSTAIPGMPAKPVIDMMASVNSLEASQAAKDRLVEVGYVYFPYRPDIMHWFCKPSAAFRTHHLHLVPLGSKRWRECLAFRDTIRRHDKLATEYAALKKVLAEKFKFDREAYTDGKEPFVQHVLQTGEPFVTTGNQRLADRHAI